MAVRKVPAKYKASDGQEFDTEKEAKRHDRLILAREEYDKARHNFKQLLAETQSTADGFKFDLGRSWSYYYIASNWYGLPELREVSFYIWNLNFDEDDALVIYDNKQEKRHDYRINELYWEKRNAELALLKAQEERLAEYAERVAELRTKLTPET